MSRSYVPRAATASQLSEYLLHRALRSQGIVSLDSVCYMDAPRKAAGTAGKRVRKAAARATKRALFVSSPIGLGHARRDLAIARELRALHPDLEIDWLAQHPVTAVLDRDLEVEGGDRTLFEAITLRTIPAPAANSTRATTA